jgi:hypothetical protein
MKRAYRRSGASLLETIVVLAIMAGLAAVVTGRIIHEPDAPEDVLRRSVAVHRDSALRSRSPVRFHLEHGGRVHAATAMPDGTVLTAAGLPIHWLTGRVDDEE